MAWTAPRTWVTGETVRARYFNTDVRDNLVALVGQYAEVITSETTTSTTYTDLATVGPSVGVNVTGSQVFVIMGSRIANNTASDGGLAAVDVSGANVSAVSDVIGGFFANNATTTGNATRMFVNLYTGLVAGQTTFALKYRAVTGGTASFFERWVFAIAAGN